MKKLLLCLYLLSIGLLSSANNDTTSSWSYASRIFHGTTNQIKGIKADTNGNVYYTGYGYEINPGNTHALIAGKLNDTLGYVWKKHFPGFITNAGLQPIIVDDSNVVIVGAYNTSISFPNDTFTTATSNSENFLLCLNASNGDVRWVVDLKRKEASTLHWDGNGDLVLGYSAFNGPQQYNGQYIDTITLPSSLLRGYAYLTIDKATGALLNHCFGANDILGSPLNNQLVGRSIHSLFVQSTNFGVFVRVRELDLNTNTVTYANHNVSTNNYTYENTFYLPETKEWIVFQNHNNNDIIIGQDTIKKRTFGQAQVWKITSAIRLDSNLQVVKSVTFPTDKGISLQTLKDTSLVFTFGLFGEGYFGEDTVIWNGDTINNQYGYYTVKCNLDFENAKFQRTTTNNWSTGMEVRGVEIDNKGNYYTAFFHSKNIIANPYTITAFNKSWNHLSAIGKANDSDSTANVTSIMDLITNKNNNVFSIYPNPVSNRLSIQSQEYIESILVYDLSGKQVIIDKNASNGLDVSDLKSGMYILQIKTAKGIQSTRFIKD